ncbi:MAG: SufD family Fe-S cluster assembly protein [bacterium]|nr:SufD family Fe-S cluster assembly protein [bacterium]
MELKEFYKNYPIPLKTQHNWRYSDYNLFFDENLNTVLNFKTNLTSSYKNLEKLNNTDFINSLVFKYPEKITLFNLLNFQDGYNIEIKESGIWKLDFNYSGNFNVVRNVIKIYSDCELIINNDLINENIIKVNEVNEIYIYNKAKVKLYTKHKANNAYYHSFYYVYLTDNVDLRQLFLTFNPKYEKTHIRTILDGIDSNYAVYMLAKTDNIDHVDYRTENIHLKSNSKSLSVYRSIVNGRSRSIYTGMLRIEKEATHCVAYQNSRNLLLSKNAKVNTIPELEILNQEVVCTHGAVVSSLDEDSIYYLTSKGLSRQEAIKLITDGFLLDKLYDNFSDNIYSLVYKEITNEEEYEYI